MHRTRSATNETNLRRSPWHLLVAMFLAFVLATPGVRASSAPVMPSLAGYLIQLSGSPLFKQPVINQKEPGFFNDKEVLRFTAQLKLV